MVWYLYLSESPFSHVETDWRLTHSVSATNSCVIWQRIRFSFNASPRDLATAFFSSRTSLELTYFLSAFTIRIWKHGKKRTYVGTKVRRQHRFFVCRGLESGKKTKTIPVFYRMLQISPIQAVRQRFAHKFIAPAAPPRWSCPSPSFFPPKYSRHGDW